MVDFHTHILPGIDDGSPSAQISVEMIKALKEQGVSKVLLTPHFYAYLSSLSDFSENRESALKELVTELKKENVDIELYVGCEVLFFEELWRVEDLRQFCIKGTDCILIEMPFSQWTDSIVSTVERLSSMGLTPIIAHFERYLSHKGNLKKIYQMIEMGALLQMNCAYLEKFRTRRKGLRFIKRGMVFALGTDSHNMGKRCPNFDKAVSYLKKKLPEREMDRLMRNPLRILKNAEKVYP